MAEKFIDESKDALSGLSRAEPGIDIASNFDKRFLGKQHFKGDVEPILTIEDVYKGKKRLGGKSEEQSVVVITFKEKECAGLSDVKPFLVKPNNYELICKASGGATPESWKGVRIQMYVDRSVRFGRDVVGGVRVRPFKPKAAASEPLPPCSDCGGVIAPAMGKDARWLAAYTVKNYGVPLCADCAHKRKTAHAEPEQAETDKEGANGTTEQQ